MFLPRLVRATFAALAADIALQRGVEALGGPAEAWDRAQKEVDRSCSSKKNTVDCMSQLQLVADSSHFHIGSYPHTVCLPILKGVGVLFEYVFVFLYFFSCFCWRLASIYWLFGFCWLLASIGVLASVGFCWLFDPVGYSIYRRMTRNYIEILFFGLRWLQVIFAASSSSRRCCRCCRCCFAGGGGGGGGGGSRGFMRALPPNPPPAWRSLI